MRPSRVNEIDHVQHRCTYECAHTACMYAVTFACAHRFHSNWKYIVGEVYTTCSDDNRVARNSSQCEPSLGWLLLSALWYPCHRLCAAWPLLSESMICHRGELQHTPAVNSMCAYHAYNVLRKDHISYIFDLPISIICICRCRCYACGRRCRRRCRCRHVF
jgi:hypothetical protein